MTKRSCPQAGCELAASGRCLEGFDPPETCPHQRQFAENNSEVAVYAEQGLVDLPSGEALTDDQASRVTASGPTKVIVIAGPYGSGKTTILTALFEAFQEAPFANYTFRGSRTLVGFERRCHLGRKESGQETADTSHTSVREGVVFLHLDLAFRDGGRLTNENLLLSDISGELFRRVRDTADAIYDIQSLRRADHLCIVVDGEKIVNKETRQVARNDSRTTLRSIVEADVLSNECAVDLVITKWDLIVGPKQEIGDPELRTYLDDTVKAMQALVPKQSFRVFEVAARPPVNATVPFAHGLPTLLRCWMGHDRDGGTDKTIFLPTVPSRQIDRYTETVLAANGLWDNYAIARF